MSNRIAVVVVHGMGNQFPMDTLRGFVESLQPQGSILYSSPNRITEDREVRRLSFSKQPFDYFEYYWAHQMEEPGIGEILKWSFKLLFVKKPSASLQKHIAVTRLAVIALPLLLAGIAALGYWLLKDYINGLLALSFYGLSVLVILRFIWGFISSSAIGAIQSSIGDVIKYTVPSPKNIAVREKIRKNGMELMRKLHEAKNNDGITERYGKIILVGHSLGSIVAYDILSSLFAEYHSNYKNVPAAITQTSLDTLLKSYNNPDHTAGQYQKTQAALFDEYKTMGNQWRVHHFITMGSPLTHASMILNKKPEDFKQKKDQREFPVSPPQFDKGDKHFAFNRSFKTEPCISENLPMLFFKPSPATDVNIQILHHAAHFAVTQWTNVYFTNDWIGGEMAPEFGKGILDIQITPKNKRLRRIPFSTHTRYWDTTENEPLEKLKEILRDSQ